MSTPVPQITKSSGEIALSAWRSYPHRAEARALSQGAPAIRRKVLVPGAAVIGLLGETLAQPEDPAHEPPAPLASSRSPRCSKKPLKVSQRYGWITCGAMPAAEQHAPHCRAGLQVPRRHCRRLRHRRRAPPPGGPSAPRNRCHRQRAPGALGRQVPRPRAASTKRPAPSWPVASTILRAWTSGPAPLAGRHAGFQFRREKVTCRLDRHQASAPFSTSNADHVAHPEQIDGPSPRAESAGRSSQLSWPYRATCQDG